MHFKKTRDLVLSPGDSKGSTLDPDTVAHEHHSFLFPDNGHGAANAAGFGWRNAGSLSRHRNRARLRSRKLRARTSNAAEMVRKASAGRGAGTAQTRAQL